MADKFRKTVNWKTPGQSYFASDSEAKLPLPEEGPPPADESGAMRCTVKAGLEIETGYIGLVVGMTGTGKSWLIKDIVQHNHKKFDVVMLMCPAWDAPRRAPNYAWLSPRFKKSPSSDKELIEEMDKILAWTKKHPGKEVLIVIDDCQGLCDVKSKAWSRIAVMTRHTGITILVAFQALQKTDTIFRDNSRYLFVTEVGGSSIPIISGITNRPKSEIIKIQELANKANKFNCVRYEMRGGQDPKIFLPPPAENFWLACRW